MTLEIYCYTCAWISERRHTRKACDERRYLLEALSHRWDPRRDALLTNWWRRSIRRGC